MEALLETLLVINFRGHQRLVACVHAILSVHGIYTTVKKAKVYMHADMHGVLIIILYNNMLSN